MITFIALAIALVALAMAFVLLPLLRNRAGGDIDRASANLGILKDQLAELENDHRRGSVSDAHYAEAKAELERRVLEEVQAGQPAAGVRHKGAVQAAAVTLALVLPIGSALIYARLGDPQAFGSARVQAADDGHAMAPEQIEKMLGSLKERLAREPDNANGWATLARTYYSMGRFGEAADAYGKLVKLVPDNADILADYADSLAMARGRQLAGEPMALIAKALKLDPTQWKALAMAGTDAFNQGDYKSAVARWEALRAILPPEASITQSIDGSIAEARQRAGMPAPGPMTAQGMPKDDAHKAAAKGGSAAGKAAGPEGKPAAVASVGGTVTLSPALLARAAPTDAVFVFARSASGGRMPIALTTLQVKDLPARFTLDDDQSISPSNRLSGQTEVIVGARISKRGSPMPQSGDLEGLSRPVKLGTRDASVLIDTVLP
jgi:cytochrome c-type biogenesis protein CcmH